MRDMVRLSRRLMLLLACVVVAFAASSVRGVAAASAEVRNPSGIAVIVGNKAYRHERVPEVSYAHRDAAAFRRYVVEVLGYDPENVIDLRDADQATLESVFGNDRSHEGKLWRYLDPEGGSDVVVFYSGHGVPGLKDKRSYLLPVNADPDTAEINGYPLDVLYNNLSKLPEVRSVRVFLDACFSGDSDRGMLVRSASPVFVRVELPEAMRKLTVVTAASDQQLASWDEKAKHGLFTHHLLDALYGKGDVDRDGQVTAAEAKRYLDRHMTRAARRTYGRHQRATLAGDETVVLASAVKGNFTARPVLIAMREELEAANNTLTVRTAPTDTKIRVAGKVYQEGMRFKPGDYVVSVEAKDHERFHGKLTIEGPTVYEISLCRLKNRTERVCEAKKVTRYRTKIKKGRRVRYSEDSLVIESDPLGNNRSYNQRITKTACDEAKEDLKDDIGYEDDGGISFMKGECSYGEKFVEDSVGKIQINTWIAVLSFDSRFWAHRCQATISWKCREEKEARMPYTVTEGICRDETRKERVCPQNVVTRVQ